MKTGKIAAWAVIVALCSIAQVWANSSPVVSNVSVSQRADGSGIVDIYYTLADGDNDRCTIIVQVSDNGGSIWSITPSGSALSGNLNNVYPGNRHIAWASKSDLPGAFGSNYRINVTADDGKPPVDMAYIPGGTFQMGDSFNEGGTYERPVHTVTISPFYVGKYEITNQQYCDFLNSALGPGLITVISNVVYKPASGTNNPYCTTYQSAIYSQINWNGSVFSVRTKSGRSMANDPMVSVTWYGAVAYCNWLSQQEGRQQCYNLSTWACDSNKRGYRLPTEAQWEYAARGGLSGKRFPWGDDIYHTQANYNSNASYTYDKGPTRSYHPLWNDGIYPFTSPVGFFDGTLKYKANCNWPGSATSYQTTSGGNSYGLFDMAGNVWEWCNDWYSSSYYSSSPTDNPTGPTGGDGRVSRGGVWDNSQSAYYSRVASRGPHDPGYLAGDNGGFRIVLDLN